MKGSLPGETWARGGVGGIERDLVGREGTL